jgi:hypothetical protein
VTPELFVQDQLKEKNRIEKFEKDGQKDQIIQ